MRMSLFGALASMLISLPAALANESLYISPTMVGNGEAGQVDLSVKGCNYLHLIVDIADKNNWNDHADWAEAKVTNEAGQSVHLGDMRPLYKDQQWGALQIDKSVDGQVLQIGKRTFNRGLGTHAYSHLIYQLDGKYERFSSFIGVDASQQEKGSIIFRVESADQYVNPAKVAAPRDEAWWYEQSNGYSKLAEQSERIDLVFLGDSITQGWRDGGKNVWQDYYAPRYAVNFGIGGDRTENSLWRVFNGNFEGIIARQNPKVVVLMIGTNNSGSQDPTSIAEGVKANIDAILSKSPLSRILLLAIFPRGQQPQDEGRLVVKESNKLIQGYADNKTIFFLDIGAYFLMQDGTISSGVMADYLHPTEKGYQIWAENMEPTLVQLLQQKY